MGWDVVLLAPWIIVFYIMYKDLFREEEDL